jgi:hypothetical protein
MNRRQFVTALGATGAAALAGCTQGTESDDETTETDTSTDAGTETGSTPDGDPATVVETFITRAAEGDREGAVDLLHPKHPMHPDNVPADEEFEFGSSVASVERVTAEVRTRTATAADAGSIAGADFFFDDGELASVLDGRDAAIVSAQAVGERTIEYRSLVTTADGEWRILWQGVETEAASDPATLHPRIVSEVSVADGGGSADVRFAASAPEGAVTVRSTGAGDDVSVESPADAGSVTVDLDPAGDEVVVTTTVDGETRPVYRERTGARRIVEAVRVQPPENEDSPWGMTARVVVTDFESDGSLRAESTRSGAENAIEPAGAANYIVVGIHEESDEVVVTLTEDGETEEVHRERVTA